MVRRTTSTGRHRIEMRFIMDKTKRQVTFSKRRPTLFKACSHLSLDFPGARVAAVVFSEAGKLFSVGCPSVEAVLQLNEDDSDDLEALEELHGAKVAAAKQVADKMQQMKAVGNKVVQAQVQAGRRFWWEADTEMLGAAELPEFKRALQRIRDNVSRHVDKLARRHPPAPPSIAAHAALY